MQEQIFDLLLQEEEVSWKTILYDLVKTEQMDPWDINITLLTQKYIEVIKHMQEQNLRISGKILLAAAFLLKLKSAHLVDTDISRLDQLLNQGEEALQEFEEDFDDGLQDMRKIFKDSKYALIPRQPQPRNRKMAIQDLVMALQRAMATRKRALEKIRPIKFEMPTRKIDIMEVIRDVYHKVEYYQAKDGQNEVSFTRLLPPNAGKEDKVYTFLPLLHLENEHKIEIKQQKAFDEIYLSLVKNGKKAS